MEWINVKDRLPEPYVSVICYDKIYNCIHEGYIDYKGNWFMTHYWEGFVPYYWIPIPELPKEVQHE